MYIPHAPLWCWVLQGEDPLFFSQPTLAPFDLGLHDLSFLRAAIARCQYQTQLVLDDAAEEAVLTPPVQCGVIASLDPEGRSLCTFHLAQVWTCRECGAWLKPTQVGFCSWACHEAWAQEDDA